jgi:CheY-like chemotaxis protein
MKAILLIEDDTSLLRLEETVLRDAGYQTDAAADGDQARAKAKATPYHGIVLDLTVPGGDYALAEQIGGSDANRHTPLIILGSDEPKGRQRAFDAGAMAFLPKPFTAEAFRSVIHSVISPAGPRPPGAPRPAPPRAATVRRIGPAPVPSAPSRFTPPPELDDAEPDVAPTVEVEGSLPVSYQGGPVYWCPPTADGWRCGRCELGLIGSPTVGATCSVCQAAVVAVETGSGGGGVIWLVLVLVIGLIAGWLLLTWWR